MINILKTEVGKTKLTIGYLYHETYRKPNVIRFVIDLFLGEMTYGESMENIRLNFMEK